MRLSLPGRREFSQLTIPALFLAVACVRIAVVGLYAESIPYWDQWDAEGRRLLAPWLEGNLTWDEVLVNPHNEHRIVWTRLLFLALFTLNGGQWDNLVVVYANTLIFAAIYTFLFATLVRGLSTTWQKAVLAGVLIILAVLPYAWENTLVGFQNQFYFLTGFAAATLALAASGANRMLTVVGVAALAFGSLFTMASGPLVAPIAAALLLLRVQAGSLGRAPGFVGAGLLLAIALGGFAALPEFSPHADWKADSLQSWLDAFRVPGSWPLSPSWFHVLLAWSPLLFYCAVRIRLGRPSSTDLLSLGLSAWVLAHAAAIAYSRGSNIQGLSSRYGDLMAIGVVANVWFGLRAFDPWSGRVRTALLQRAVGLASAIAVLAAFLQRAPDDFNEMVWRSDSFRRQTENVRAFVADGDPVHLAGDIPYPDATQLQGMLSNEAIRRALPPTLRKGLSLGGSAREPFIALGSIVSSCGAAQCAEGVGRWRSDDLTTSFDFIRLPFSYGEATNGFKLGVCGSKATRRCSLEPLSGRVYTATASVEPFHVELADETSASWIALGSAIEINWLSLLSRNAKGWTRRAIPHRSRFTQPRVAPRDLPCQDESPDVWNLNEGASVHAEVPVSQAGFVMGIAASRGPYNKKADGWLHAEVCAGGRCSTSELRLRRVRHGWSFDLPLATPLAVHAGDTLQVRIWPEALTEPVAFANCLAQPGSARVWGDPTFDTQGRTLQLRLDYLQVN
jgi:hypothetical protein